MVIPALVSRDLLFLEVCVGFEGLDEGINLIEISPAFAVLSLEKGLKPLVF